MEARLDRRNLIPTQRKVLEAIQDELSYGKGREITTINAIYERLGESNSTTVSSDGRVVLVFRQEGVQLYGCSSYLRATVGLRTAAVGQIVE